MVFVFFEVVYFGNASTVQTIFAVLMYVFTAFVITLNKKVGVMYFIAFSLCTIGEWSYVLGTINPNNFWGLRLAGFSLNTIFVIGISGFLLITSKGKYKFWSISLYKYLIIFTLYGIIIGFYNWAIGSNYFDNYIKDVFTYVPILFYIYLITYLKSSQLKLVLKYSIIGSVLLFSLSMILDKEFFYSINDSYLLMNSIVYVLPILILFIKDLFTTKVYVLLCIGVFIPFFFGNYFLGGKFLVMVLLVIAWYFFVGNKRYMLAPLIGFVAFFYIIPAIEFLRSIYIDDVVIYSRVTQVLNLLTIQDISYLAKSGNSIGNLVAEGLTIIKLLSDNILFAILGKGFGGGIPDLYGYLKPWAGMSGYAAQDAVRGEYYRMHLPIYEIIVKVGIIGTIPFIFICLKYFLDKNRYSFLTFLLLTTVFYVSKEMLLLTLIMAFLSKSYNDKNVVLRS